MSILNHADEFFRLKGEELALTKLYYSTIELADFARRYTPAVYPQTRKHAKEAYKRMLDKHAEVLALLVKYERED